MPHRDFLTLVSNPSHGNVYVVGDVHGEIGALNAALERLNENDTLIIAGDLIDRGQQRQGPSSALVLDRIMALNSAPAGNGPRVHAIKGNHEQYFLDALTLLRKPTPFSSKDLQTMMRFVMNGGGWILKDPGGKNRDLQAWCHEYAFRRAPTSEGVVRYFIIKMLESPNPFDFVIHNIGEYEAYVRALPYIIKVVENEKMAWVAHADLPLTDEELDDRIESGEGLSFEEIKYITEARPEHFGSRRNAESIVVFCGHNIIDEPWSSASQGYFPALPVREETHHINLDVGAYFTRGLLLMNFTHSVAEIVVSSISTQNGSLLTYARDQVNAYFSDQLSRRLSNSRVDQVGFLALPIVSPVVILEPSQIPVTESGFFTGRKRTHGSDDDGLDDDSSERKSPKTSP